MIRNGLRALVKATETVTRCSSTPSRSGLLNPLWSNDIRSAVPCASTVTSLHTSSSVCAVWNKLPKEPVRWPKYNEVVYPPREPDEPKRPAEYYHHRAHVRVMTKKLFYLVGMVRGLSVDEAIKQLSFKKQIHSTVLKDIIEEGQEIAVRDHHFEFKSNMWIADMSTKTSYVVKGMRKHARMRMGEVRYQYTNVYVLFREGKPPKHYYTPEPTGNEKLQTKLDDMRKRRITHSV